MTADLDRAAFETWLRAQEPAAVVGTAWEPYACPLANWLGDLWGDNVTVSHNGYVRNKRPRAAPDWFTQFAKAVDGPAPHKGTALRPITAADALAVLAEVPA